jgi:tetratricopeptide (TPR) repeat protein
MGEMRLSRGRAAAGLLAVGVLLASGCTSARDLEVRRLQARSAYEQGLSNLEEKRLALGLASLKEAVRLEPGHAIYRNALGVVLLDMGKPKEAEAEFRRAIRIDSSYAEAHHNLGLSLAEQGRLVDAVSSYRRALSLPVYPTPEVGYYNLGNAYLRLNRPGEAEEAFRTAIQLSPRLIAAYYGLGIVLAGGGRREEARAAFATARDLDPTSPFGQAAGEALKALGSAK